MTPKQTALSRYIDKFSPPVGLLLFILSIVIGAGTGLAAVLFIKLIAAIQYIGYSRLPELLPILRCTDILYRSGCWADCLSDR